MVFVESRIVPDRVSLVKPSGPTTQFIQMIVEQFDIRRSRARLAIRVTRQSFE